MSKWNDAGDFFMAVAKTMKREGKILLPPKGILPSEEEESQIDLWFLEASKTLKMPVNPAPNLAPWILARLVSCSGLARTAGETAGLPDPPPTTGEAIKMLAIGEWHGRMKRLWLVKDTSSGRN